MRHACRDADLGEVVPQHDDLTSVDVADTRAVPSPQLMLDAGQTRCGARVGEADRSEVTMLWHYLAEVDVATCMPHQGPRVASPTSLR